MSAEPQLQAPMPVHNESSALMLNPKSLFLSSSTRYEAFLSPKKPAPTPFPICELPSFLLMSIFPFLDIADFFRLVCTCKRLASFQNNQRLWKSLCTKSWKDLHLPNVRSLPFVSDWKALARCFMVQVNLLSDKSKFSGEGFSKTSNDLYFGSFLKGQCHGKGFRLYFQIPPVPSPEENNTNTTDNNGNVEMLTNDDQNQQGEDDQFHEEDEETNSSHTSNNTSNNGKKRLRKREEYVKFDLYDGEWQADLPNGLGTKRWINGDSYQGYWRQGYTHGHGIYAWGIGDKYEGNYNEGKRNGEGTYHYADGSKYVGAWLNHKQHGFGKRIYLNGNIYEGEWCEGNLEGKGYFKWQDHSDYHGDVYTGNWRDNTEHGQGEYKSAFGTVYSGTYNMGIRQGDGKFSHPDGYNWQGKWNNDIPGDLDCALHPKMREVLESGKCTQTLTNNAPFYGQVLFRCLDCHGSEDPEKRRYVCQNCIETCHKTHRIEKKIWTCGRSFCWCPCCQDKDKHNH